MTFWIITAILVAVAVAWLAPTLLRKRQIQDLDRQQQNIAIAKERLDEIAADHASGEMTDDVYQKAREELEASLIEDVKATEPEKQEVPQHSEKAGFATLIALAILLPIGTVAFYNHLGSPEYLSYVGGGAGKQEDLQQMASNADSIDELINRLQQRLDKTPGDGEGWYLLSRSYMAQEKYPEALNALEKARELIGDHPNILLGIADAEAMTKEGDLTGRPSVYIDKTLEMEPENTTALWLGGMAAQQNGMFQLAVDRWAKLIPLIADEPDSQVQVRELLNEAVAQARAAGIQVNLPDIKMPASKSIKVRLQANLPDGANVAPDNVIYVFARNNDGNPMPLAAYKTTLSELPIDITLDDTRSILPSMKLSSASEILVSARLSLTGEPLPQPGDFSSDLVSLPLTETSEVELVISHQVNDPAAIPTRNLLDAGATSEQVTNASAANSENGQTSAAPGAVPGAVAVNAWVSLDAAMQNQVNANDTVFVFARAASGPPMPLAAFKTTVSELPLEVTLDDSMAMMPQMKMSGFEQVIVTARVSRSGQPMAGPGDLTSEAVTVNLNDEAAGTVAVELPINQQIQ